MNKQAVFIIIIISVFVLKFIFNLCLYYEPFDNNYFTRVNKNFLSKDFKKLPYKVLFVGVCRDVDTYINDILKNIDVLRSMFVKTEVIFFENDSKDKTLDIIKNYDCVVLSEKNIKIGKRSQRIEYCRNKILEYINNYNLIDEYDYMVVLDLDDTNQQIDYKGFYDSFNLSEKWDMLGANSYRYYDTWALRTENLNFNKETNTIKHLWNSIKGPINTHYFDNIKTTKDFENKIHPVLSCFNGLGIYNIKKIKGCYYDSYKGEDCEHIGFHKCMREKHNAKIFINPKLKVKGGLYLLYFLKIT